MTHYNIQREYYITSKMKYELDCVITSYITNLLTPWTHWSESLQLTKSNSHNLHFLIRVLSVMEKLSIKQLVYIDFWILFVDHLKLQTVRQIQVLRDLIEQFQECTLAALTLLLPANMALVQSICIKVDILIHHYYHKLH